MNDIPSEVLRAPAHAWQKASVPPYYGPPHIEPFLLRAGYGGITPDKCESYGCCYVPSAPTTGAAFLTLPVCFYKNGGDSSYSLRGGLQPSGMCISPASD